MLKCRNKSISAWHILRSLTGDYEDTVREIINPSISEIMNKLEGIY